MTEQVEHIWECSCGKKITVNEEYKMTYAWKCMDCFENLSRRLRAAAKHKAEFGHE